MLLQNIVARDEIQIFSYPPVENGHGNFLIDRQLFFSRMFL